MAKKLNYGTAKHEEIIAGVELATEFASKMRDFSPAVQNMIKELIALFDVRPPIATEEK
jgi:hypothetical protein